MYTVRREVDIADELFAYELRLEFNSLRPRELFWTCRGQGHANSAVEGVNARNGYAVSIHTRDHKTTALCFGCCGGLLGKSHSRRSVSDTHSGSIERLRKTLPSKSTYRLYEVVNWNTRCAHQMIARSSVGRYLGPGFAELTWTLTLCALAISGYTAETIHAFNVAGGWTGAT